MLPRPDSFSNAFDNCIQESVKTSSALLTQVLVIGRRSMVETRLNTQSPEMLLALHNAVHMLVKHENTLVEAFPIALKKQFDEALSNATNTVERKEGVAFHKLALLQEHEFSAQMALSHLRHNVISATEVDCALLNSYTSSAQGLQRVQPEKNPFQPESYIRALQQSFEIAGVDFQSRQLWFQHMGAALGNELVLLYKELIRRLTAQGVEPINYAKPRPAPPPATEPSPEEAMPVVVPPVAAAVAPLFPPVHAYAQAEFSGFSMLRSFNESDLAFPSLHSSPPAEPSLTFPTLMPDPEPVAAAEPIVPVAPLVPSDPVSPFAIDKVVNAGEMDTLMQSFDFITELTNSLPTSDEDLASLRNQPEFEFLPPKRVEQDTIDPDPEVEDGIHSSVALVPAFEAGAKDTPPQNMPPASTTAAIQELLEQLISRQPMPGALRHVVRSFELALVRLAQRDGRIFADEQHPARKLLASVIQRGLRYRDANSNQFNKFIALANDTVRYLIALPVHDATAFEHMYLMWERSWEKTSSDNLIARAAAGHDDAFQALVQEHALAFAAFPAAQSAPEHWRDFLTGPWARVSAHMQCAGDRQRAGKYLSIAPVLLWCVQPSIESDDARRLLPWMDSIRSHVRDGLSSLGYSADEVGPLLQRVDRIQTALENIANPERAPAANVESVSSKTEETSQLEMFLKPLATGQWFDMWSKQRFVRTQLTWVNDNRTSFMFTATDGSTQSFTRRMLEGLIAKDGLQRVSDQNAERVSEFPGSSKHSTG